MRTILVLAGLLAVGAVPVSGAAQHGATPATPAVKTEAAATHAAPPAKPSDTPAGKQAAKASAKPTTEKPADRPAATPVEKAPIPTHETAAAHGAKPPSAAKAATAPAVPAAVAGHDTKAGGDVKPVAKAGTHEGKASDKAVEKTAVTARRVAPKSDLEAVFDRIAQKIDGAEVMPGGLRISSGSPLTPARAAEGRPAQARAARADAASRLRLTWRCSVVWPSTLWPAESPGAEPAHDVSHITLAWQ